MEQAMRERLEKRLEFVISKIKEYALATTYSKQGKMRAAFRLEAFALQKQLETEE